MVELVRETLHTSVADPVAASINFLNEVANRFPAAISLAAGRPSDEFYAVEDAEPCYVGFTGAARVLGVTLVPVPEAAQGLRPETVARVAREVRAAGRRRRALYVVSNFANPSGVSLSADVRRGLIEVAADHDLLILEDDPYVLFGLDDKRCPAPKSQDTDHRVMYLGSFPKSVFPGARVGFLVADQTVVSAAGHRSLLADELSTVKSMITLNTSPTAQAVIGGVLASCEYSLRAANREKIAFYRRNLRALLGALERHFSDPAITWNSPSGGFFAVLGVPVCADEKLLELSARDYGVL